MLENISIFTMAVSWTTVREECKKQVSDSPQLNKHTHSSPPVASPFLLPVCPLLFFPQLILTSAMRPALSSSSSSTSSSPPSSTPASAQVSRWADFSSSALFCTIVFTWPLWYYMCVRGGDTWCSNTDITHDLTAISMVSCRTSNNDTFCVSITDVSQN